MMWMPQSRKATLHAYDADGKATASKEVEIDANAATTIDIKDLSKDNESAVLLMLEDQSQQIGWGVRLTHADLGDGKVAGLASLGATSLMPATTHVWARSNPSIVH